MFFEWLTELNAADAAGILAIVNAVASREGTNGVPRPLTEAEGEYFTAALRGAIERGDCCQLAARDTSGGRIVAIATLEPVKLNPARRHVVEIKRMAADPEVRGFGNYILGGWAFILDKCRRQGYDVINIDVSEDGPWRMWQKIGFHVYAKVDDYARVGTRILEGYFLSVNLKEACRILSKFQAHLGWKIEGSDEPARASSPVESSAGIGISRPAASSGSSVHPNTTASHP
jgi:GNAT superfamily N-acetyltransferase